MTSPAIAYTLFMPLSSVGLELRRLGLNRLSRLEPKPSGASVPQYFLIIRGEVVI